MKKVLWAAAAATAFIASSAQANITVTVADGSATYTGGTTFNFDTTTPVTTCSNCVVSGTISGQYAQPLGSTGNYFSTGPSTTEPATISFGAIGEYWMSMIWGSVDSYNTLQFIDALGNNLGPLFTGSDISNPANGNQTDENTNPIATFHFSGTDAARVAGFRMTSGGQNAFEIDNIRVVGVPEPMTWAMMIMGFGMIGGMLRRRSTKVSYA